MLERPGIAGGRETRQKISLFELIISPGSVSISEVMERRSDGFYPCHSWWLCDS